MQGYHPQQQYYPPQAAYPPQTFQPSYPYPQYPVQPVLAPGQPPPQGYQSFPNYRAQDQYEPQQPAPQQLAPRPKHLRRSQTTAAQNSKAVPLKSAMKRSQHDRSTSMSAAGPITPDLSRTSSRATSEQRHRANSNASRHRANSIQPPMDGPGHIFVTFTGSNELRVENIPDETLVEDFRQTLPFEWPHGLTNEEHRSHRWRAQFGGTPWSSSGSDSIRARAIICGMYQILAVRGYSYITTINTNSTPPRLVFLFTAPDPMADFFSILLSQNGEKLSLQGIHPQVAHALGDNLRAIFPHKIASDRAREDGIHIIELRKGLGSEVDHTVFHACILRFFSSHGYKLDGSIPMGKASPLGFGSRKELWVFRGSRPRAASGLGQREF